MPKNGLTNREDLKMNEFTATSIPSGQKYSVMPSPLGGGRNNDGLYLAHTSDDREVFIKFLQPGEDNIDIATEAESLAFAPSQYAVKILDLVEMHGKKGIVMENIAPTRGETIESRINQGDLSTGEIQTIATQLAAFIEEYKKRVHADLNAKNIFYLPKEEEIRVVDFGIAERTDVTKEDAILIKGTLLYLSPERFQGKQPTLTDEIYSIGSLVYRMITGKGYLTQDANSAEAAYAHAIVNKNFYQGMVNSGRFSPEQARSVATVLEKAMHPERQGRYQSGAEFAQALSDALPTINRTQPRS